MKTLTRLNVDQLKKEMPVLSDIELTGIIGGYQLVITMNRYGYSDGTTASTFSVNAYDTCGNVSDVLLSGYFLEPRTDYGLCGTEGSNTAIASGSYSIIQRADGKWELQDVAGRTYIQIHEGYSSGWTSGCLLPGCGVEQNSSGDYHIPSGSSSGITSELFDLMDYYYSNYGNVQININE